jgi:nuclear GTP-binding protein
MERSNPLSRRVLKREAKRARKAQKVRVEDDGSLEMDDEGLQFTFMA